MRFSGEEASKFVGSFFAAAVARIRECLSLAWSSEFSQALDKFLGASDRVRAAVAAADRAHVSIATLVFNDDLVRARAADSRVRATADLAADVAVCCSYFFCSYIDS
ncbi:hypothetical protein [Candidatus Ichthyocystis sparus]|uniref:hypothetical protein n=1 Tax=Candidatus Ichthyocystis sparus TaxID=1561004 RepID=UPI000B84FC18|nr:hypothetical protein [Candidatus Ichthyocystis sparus]